MISFIRRALSSWIVLGLFGLILVSFLVTGQFTNGMGGIDTLAGGGGLAKVGGSSIDPTEAGNRIQAQLTAARQEQPALDMAGFMSQGGAELTIDQMINGRAFEAFGKSNGMFISPRLVDGEIASIAAFNGPTGKFDRNTFLSILSQRKLTEAQVRSDLARDKMSNALIIPAGGGARAPNGLAAPYASLLLETRTGLVAAIPAEAMAKGMTPTDAELTTYYGRQVARYTVPETRIVRYALFERARFTDKAVATDAQIAVAYKANAASYAGKETRVFTQVILPDQKAAQALVTSVRGGAALSAAAKTAGSEATTLAAQDQESFAGLTSAGIAKAAFGAARGTLLDPQKSAFGWSVVRVDGINPKITKSLADVRATLAAEIGRKNLDGAISDFVTKIEDDVAGGATFDDVVKTNGLSVITTPAVTASGIAPDAPGFKGGKELPVILRDAFQAEPDDDAQVITLAAGQAYAFTDLDKVNPAAPRPLAQIRAQVTADFEQDRATKAARKIADAIAAKVNSGAALPAAVAGTGLRLPAPQPAGSRRLEIEQARASGTKIPPALAFLFTMRPKSAKVLELPDNKGWYIVWLDKIVAGEATNQAGLMQAKKSQLQGQIGDEFVEQFAAAIKANVGVKKNEAAIASLKRSLTGAGAQ